MLQLYVSSSLYFQLMRNIKEILEEVQIQCHKDNCQSVKNIALLAMEKAIEEHKNFIVEKLENLSNNYEVVSGLYLIQKHTLDHFIENLESDVL